MIGAIVLSVFDDIDEPKYHENPSNEIWRTRTDISQKFHGECFAQFFVVLNIKRNVDRIRNPFRERDSALRCILQEK